MPDQDPPPSPLPSGQPPDDRDDAVLPAAAPSGPSGGLRRLDQPPLADIELESEDYQESHAPTFVERMFAIGWMGWVRLALLCILVGVLIRAAGVNPFERGFTFSGAIGDMAGALVALGGWVIANGWLPLLTGALLVIPLWMVWRLVSLPFRGRRGQSERQDF